MTNYTVSQNNPFIRTHFKSLAHKYYHCISYVLQNLLYEVDFSE